MSQYQINTQAIERLGAELNCTPGYEPYINACQQCTQGQTSDGGNSSCYCPLGTRLYLLSCQLCPAGEHSAKKNSTDCTTCPNGLYSRLFYADCISKEDCLKIGFEINEKQKSCDCGQDKVLSVDRTKCLLTCGNLAKNLTITSKNGSYSQTFCQCENGYVLGLNGDECTKRYECEDDPSTTVKNYACVCADGYQLQDQQCIQQRINCSQNQYVYQNSCINCPQNSQSKGGKVTSCVCQNNLIWDDGKCISQQGGDDSNKNKHSSLSVGAIVGIVFGILILLAIVIAVPLLVKNNRRKNAIKYREGAEHNLMI